MSFHRLAHICRCAQLQANDAALQARSAAQNRTRSAERDQRRVVLSPVIGSFADPIEGAFTAPMSAGVTVRTRTSWPCGRARRCPGRRVRCRDCSPRELEARSRARQSSAPRMRAGTAGRIEADRSRLLVEAGRGLLHRSHDQRGRVRRTWSCAPKGPRSFDRVVFPSWPGTAEAILPLLDGTRTLQAGASRRPPRAPVG